LPPSRSARHLEGFIRGYARFAKLPQPQLQTVDWPAFLEGLRQQIPFTLEQCPPELHGRIDPAQMQQALLNLLKNAHEASAEADEPSDGSPCVLRCPAACASKCWTAATA
jgi:nitrogen fixation/metabolism regulation signal transduction histidine kinase